jgi:N-formylglutamate amidohydrolase
VTPNHSPLYTWPIAPYTLTTRHPWRFPLLISVPHAGRHYPPELVAKTNHSTEKLRISEDALVDVLCQDAARFHGIPMLSALLPRSFLDINRCLSELDPSLIQGIPPSTPVIPSPKTKRGIGLVPRFLADGSSIWQENLTWPEVAGWIDSYYHPYHHTLGDLCTQGAQQFGRLLVLDMHSMPSMGGAVDTDLGKARADIVLSNNNGLSCSPAIMQLAAQFWQQQGFTVAINDPYQGGYITCQYANKSKNIDTLQIEFSRKIYIDENHILPNDYFSKVQEQVGMFFAYLQSALIVADIY